MVACVKSSEETVVMSDAEKGSGPIERITSPNFVIILHQIFYAEYQDCQVMEACRVFHILHEPCCG